MDEFIDICANDLSSIDDDWITAGMEIGLFKNAVIFGVYDTSDSEKLKHFVDTKGTQHTIIIRGETPGDMLGYQGSLSDIAREGHFQELWDALYWKFVPKKRFEFAKRPEKILLDMDLDCFAFEWEDFILTWTDEIFEKRFLKESDYFTTQSYSGKFFFNSLLQLTIAREDGCCGGRKKADIILNKLNEYVFEKPITETDK
jgi:hypothetical protein